MNQPEDEKGNDFSEYARARRQSLPEEVEKEESGTGSRILRGCGVAIGIAALLFMFVVGACFMAFQ